MTDRLLDMQGLADYLNVPFSWVKDKVAARAIPFTFVGKHVRFRPDHVKQIETEGDQPVVQLGQSTTPPGTPGPSYPPPQPDRPAGPGRRLNTVRAA